MTENRSKFSSRIGFVLAAAGSAVGLGNIWRFPYLAAKYGGGIFLFVYLILVVSFGFTLMATEIAIGRSTRLSCVEAFGKLNNKFRFLGPLTAMIPILIVPYYCVIGGWVMKYLVEFLMGHGAALAGDAYFSSFISIAAKGILNHPLPWFLGYVLLNSAVLLLGVNKGIESMSKFMMPLLVILAALISIYSLSLPGAIEGLKFYLLPDFSKLSFSTILGAMTQMFYSMSLAMGIMITYGSYMRDEDNLEDSITQIQIFDTGVAMLAGLMVVPSVVAFNGGTTDGITAGPGLMFGVLPKVFETMDKGNLVGTAFFVLVFLAALTSSISLLETFVSIIQDRFHTTRTGTILGVSLFTMVMGTLSCLGYGPLGGVTLLGMSFLDFFDFLANSLLMPIAALLTCVLVGYVVGPKFVADEITKTGRPFRREKLYNIIIRYVAPLLLAIILIGEIAKFFGLISI